MAAKSRAPSGSERGLKERRGPDHHYAAKRPKVLSEECGPMMLIRSGIERGINRLRHARRVAARYDKTVASYLGLVQLTAVRLWLRHVVNTP